MNHKFLVLLIYIDVVLGSALPAESREIDQKTREMLDTIIAGYRSNRARLSDLTMSGSILTIQGEGENQTKLETTYNYYELGDKRRIDESYPADMGVPMLAGRTKILTFTGKGTLQYYSGHQLYKDSASVNEVHKFHMSSNITYLDTISQTRSWRSHMGHIQHLLDRGWRPETQTIDVETVNRQGSALLQITYKTKGTIEYVYTVDPHRGYEATEVVRKTDYETGMPYRRTIATYQISEVLPGVWRPTGGTLVFDHWDQSGNNTHTILQIKSERVSANTGTINGELFTFEGMGLRPGSLVEDRTVKPPVRYQYGGPRFPEFEDLLEETSVSSSKSLPNAEPEGEQIGAAQEEIPQQTIMDGDSLRPKDERRRGSSIIPWVLVILIISGLLGFIFQKSIKSVHHKRTLQVILFVCLSMLISSEGKPSEDKISNDPLLVDKELDLYENEENLCGVISLYHSLWEIGYEVSLRDILSNVAVGERGTPLSAMCKYLDKCKVPYHAVKANTVETILRVLKFKENTAILHVDKGTHFLTVKKTVDGNAVAVDGTMVIRDNAVKTLNARFSGMALIVGLRPIDAARNFTPWKTLVAIIGVAPLGFGIGALVRTFCSKQTVSKTCS